MVSLQQSKLIILNEKNFFSWKSQLMTVLASNELDDEIKDFQKNIVPKSEKTKQNQALLHLRLMLDETANGLIDGTTNIKQALNLLEKEYNLHNHEFNLINEFKSLKWNYKNGYQFVLKVKLLKKRMEKAGCVREEKDFIDLIQSQLPPSLNEFKHEIIKNILNGKNIRFEEYCNELSKKQLELDNPFKINSINELKKYLNSSYRDYFILSSAPRHIVNNKCYFSKYTTFKKKMVLRFISESYAYGVGSVPVRCLVDNKETEFVIEDVLYVPTAGLNQLSEIQFHENGFEIETSKNNQKYVLLNKKKIMVAKDEKLYCFEIAGKYLNIFRTEKGIPNYISMFFID